MRLVVTEKNDAAQQISTLLSTGGKPKADKVYSTPVYRFTRAGQEWVCIGLRGHILAVDFPHELRYEQGKGWFGVVDDGTTVPAELPESLPRPPFEKVRKPFLKDGVDIKGWKVPSLPYLVWSPVEKLPAEKDIIRSLKNVAKKADDIIIATDFDREGELIGSDAVSQIREVNPDAPILRARYSAFTRGEIEHAFAPENLVALDVDLAAAGESRQQIDLIWGAVLTRYLTMAKFGGLGNVRSAGRVQTPTLALVVAREKERMAFVPEDYWVVRAGLSASDGTPVKATHTTARFKDKSAAQSAYERARAAKTARVTDVAKRSRTVGAPEPFNTTSLQAAAASEGLSPARTMRLAESLYMSGLISYPRVDNTVYPKTLDLGDTVRTLRGVPQYAGYCAELLAKGELHATRGKQETTDHPPIYPTGAADPDKLRADEWKLYNLIARRFLATLSGPATLQSTRVSFDVGGEPFGASGTVLAVPGFRAIYPFGLKRDEVMPACAVGDEFAVDEVALDAKQTEPPARYSQGRLVQEMERLGLGTKSTRASIIERLYEVKYLKNDPIEPSQLGIAIIDALSQYAGHVTTPDMTSQLEDDMTSVAAGEKTEKGVVTHSRELLSGMLGSLIEHKDDLGDAISDAVTADAKVGVCPKCGHDLLVKTSAKNRSQFVGCSAWPDCDVTYPLPKGRIEPIEDRCPVCGGSQIKVHPFRSKAYVACLDPKCPTNAEPDVDVGACPVCREAGRDGRLVAHKSDRTLKRFIRCTNYDECGVSYPLPQRGKLEATGETCPECGAPMVVVQSSRGPWKFCVNMECPAKERAAQEKAARGAARSGGASAGKTAKSKAKPSTKAARPAAKKGARSRAGSSAKADAGQAAPGAAE